MIPIPKLNLRNFIFVAAIAGLGGFFGLLWVARYSSMNPKYCLTCHAVGDTPNIGYGSEIHPSFKDVNCIECHAESDTVVMGTIADGYRGGFSADPDRVSKNCIRCHKEVAESGVKEFKFNVMNINIPHKKHLDMGILCVDCHDNITHDQNKRKTFRPSMENCMQCHDHTKNNCYTCHSKESLELPLMETISFEEECTSCHGDFKSETIDVYDLKFSHENHLERGVACNICHSNAEKHGKVIGKKECNQCHGVKFLHEPGWAFTHKETARRSSDTCHKCHQPDFCQSCHQLEMPHPFNWRRIHDEQARDNLGTCAICHKTNSSCKACHDTIAPSSHEPDWIMDHSGEVKSEGNYCHVCHDQDYCLNCHSEPMS